MAKSTTTQTRTPGSQGDDARAAPPPPRAAPQGQRMTGNMGPGTLYPGVGKIVQKTGIAQYCGTMSGVCVGYLEHPNSKDAKRTSVRFTGDFIITDRHDTVSRGAECYLPGVLERGLKANLDRHPTGEGVMFSGEIWCEPDPEGRAASPLGYSYVVYNRKAQLDRDPVLELAYASGILARPQTQIGQSAEREVEIDPETGEVTDKTTGEALAAAE